MTISAIPIDPKSAVPIYAQLQGALQGMISRAAIKPGEQLPTVRQLAVDLRINANTVAKVYLELEREGFLETRRGIGTFAKKPKELPKRDRPKLLEQLAQRFLAEAQYHGITKDELIHFLKKQ